MKCAQCKECDPKFLPHISFNSLVFGQKCSQDIIAETYEQESRFILFGSVSAASFTHLNSGVFVLSLWQQKTFQIRGEIRLEVKLITVAMPNEGARDPKIRANLVFIYYCFTLLHSCVVVKEKRSSRTSAPWRNIDPESKPQVLTANRCWAVAFRCLLILEGTSSGVFLHILHVQEGRKLHVCNM